MIIIWGFQIIFLVFTDGWIAKVAAATNIVFIKDWLTKLTQLWEYYLTLESNLAAIFQIPVPPAAARLHRVATPMVLLSSIVFII